MDWSSAVRGEIFLAQYHPSTPRDPAVGAGTPKRCNHTIPPQTLQRQPNDDGWNRGRRHTHPQIRCWWVHVIFSHDGKIASFTTVCHPLRQALRPSTGVRGHTPKRRDDGNDGDDGWQFSEIPISTGKNTSRSTKQRWLLLCSRFSLHKLIYKHIHTTRLRTILSRVENNLTPLRRQADVRSLSLFLYLSLLRLLFLALAHTRTHSHSLFFSYCVSFFPTR